MIKIRYTKKAVSDLVQSYKYIFSDNKQSSAATIARMAVESICLYPEIGRKGRKDTTRELVVAGTPFIIVYRCDASYLNILTILHRSRKFPT
jgi:plasmid stabilization system protein ParE